MRGLQAKMLKIDFQHQLAKKIRVWKGPGQSCRPFHCTVTALDGHSLVVCWRALKSAESMKEMAADLKKPDLQLHCDTKSSVITVEAVHVDNCCAVSKTDEKLLEIWPNTNVRSDPFHWQQRWDVALESTASKEASCFRSAVCRAALVANEEEFSHAIIL